MRRRETRPPSGPRSPLPVARGRAEEESMEDVRGKTVLVVDDEPSVRLYLQTVLEDSGFQVQTAANGHQALDRMTEKKPDVISLDLVMPKMSGLNFFKYIQKNKERAGIPVVVVTAHARDELGSEDFQKIEKHRSEECRIFTLEKPVDAPTYVNTIRQALDLQPLGSESEEQTALRLEVSDAVQGADRESLRKALEILKGS
jgi:CheY-like chemotaxis protein